jgi:hypothetical protein
MVALQMHQEGLLDIDAPARNANPGWRVLDNYASAAITPRDMMSHRTGLPRHDQITFAARNRSAMMATLPFLPYDKQVRYQPGEYNNMMFAATGSGAFVFGQAVFLGGSGGLLLLVGFHSCCWLESNIGVIPKQQHRCDTKTMSLECHVLTRLFFFLLGLTS